jgi:hypothetical protein
MNIEACFAKLTPAPWSEVIALLPIERAMRFVIPLEDDPAKAALAKGLVGEVVAGRETTASVRWKYSGTNQEKATCFDLAASFYLACFCAMRDIVQAQDPTISEAWPRVEFNYFRRCHATCASLRKKRLHRTSAVVRTFYPPWHFGCEGYVSDSAHKASRDFTLSIRPEEMQYFHNPIDVLVSQDFMQDFPGVDFGEHASVVCQLTKLQDKLASTGS